MLHDQAIILEFEERSIEADRVDARRCHELRHCCGKRTYGRDDLPLLFGRRAQDLRELKGLRPMLPRWQQKLFLMLARLAISPGDFFGLPANRVVELGGRIEI